MAEPPVFDDWAGYVFPEESLSGLGSQRLLVRDPIASSQEGYAPFRLDVAQGGPSTMDNTLQKFMEIVTESTSNFPLNSRQTAQVTWFTTSPYEVFLEKVLAERLKTLEPGDLR